MNIELLIEGYRAIEEEIDAVGITTRGTRKTVKRAFGKNIFALMDWTYALLWQDILEGTSSLESTRAILEKNATFEEGLVLVPLLERCWSRATEDIERVKAEAQQATAHQQQQEESRRRAKILAEKLQYAQLERAERHRQQRLAEQRAREKALAEKQQRLNDPQTKAQKAQRKAEARRLAAERAEQQRAKKKAARQAWLLAHPPKNEVS